MAKFETAADAKARRFKGIAQGWAPTGVFPFFRLSREIRDMIYSYAIGTEPRGFKVEDMPVLAACEMDPLKLDSTNAGYKEENKNTIRSVWYPCGCCSVAVGLPHWFLSSKQLCSEALACFGATQTFSAANLDLQTPDVDEENRCRKPRVANSLVMNKNVIRHVAFRGSMDEFIRYGSKFLAFLYHLEIEDLTLDLEWMVCDPPFLSKWEEILKERIEKLVTGNYGCWEGKLQKVKITVPTSREHIDDPAPETENFDLVEKLAIKLLGPGAKVVWGGFKFDSSQDETGLYKRCVTAEKAG